MLVKCDRSFFVNPPVVPCGMLLQHFLCRVHMFLHELLQHTQQLSRLCTCLTQPRSTTGASYGFTATTAAPAAATTAATTAPTAAIAATVIAADCSHRGAAFAAAVGAKVTGDGSHRTAAIAAAKLAAAAAAAAVGVAAGCIGGDDVECSSGK